MSIFSAMDIAASGMTAQRLRMDTISQNLANINTTRTDSGGPYRRKMVVFEEMGEPASFANVMSRYTNRNSLKGGVKVSKIVEDQSPFISVYDPTHPDANEEGYVQMPNVNTIAEMTNLISSNRSYEANITAFNTNKAMLTKALEIGK